LLCLALSLGPILVGASSASQPSLGPDELSQIRFEQHLGKQISLELQFVDESSRPVQLQEYFRGKPVMLMLGYYGCPMLCGLTLNGFVETLQDLKATSGKDFEFLFISIDPSEAPTLAREKKTRYLKRYGRPGATNGWHFLTASQPAIPKLASEVGFHFRYDPASKQFAHPSGFVVLTPDGTIARYFFGVTFSASELSTALKRASGNQISSPVQNLLLLCFHYTPITGRYGALVMTLVRIMAAFTLFALIFLIVRHLRRAPTAPALSTKGGSG
jgi:protein SCO1/2